MNTPNGQHDSLVVLAGIDLGELSEATLRVAAAQCPQGSGRELHVVHVLPQLSTGGIGEPAADRTLGFIKQMEAGRSRIDAMAGMVAGSVGRLVVHLRGGEPDVENAQLASDLRAGLIVVATHGKKGIVRLLLGSVAESLVRNAPCPVLAYRPRTEAAWEKIVPPCPDCLATQQETKRARLWCERHAQHHPR